MGLVSFEMAHNFWSDLTQEEREQQMGLKLPKAVSQSDGISSKTSMSANFSLPSCVDWRNKLQPIKDQGGCGYGI